MNWLTINLWIIITYIFDIFNNITRFWILIIQIKKLLSLYSFLYSKISKFTSWIDKQLFLD